MEDTQAVSVPLTVWDFLFKQFGRMRPPLAPTRPNSRQHGARFALIVLTLVQSLNLDHCEVLCVAASADGTALFCGLDDGGLAVLAPGAPS